MTPHAFQDIKTLGGKLPIIAIPDFTNKIGLRVDLLGSTEHASLYYAENRMKKSCKPSGAIEVSYYQHLQFWW